MEMRMALSRSRKRDRCRGYMAVISIKTKASVKELPCKLLRPIYGNKTGIRQGLDIRSEQEYVKR
jgi:hypothetical protein